MCSRRSRIAVVAWAHSGYTHAMTIAGRLIPLFSQVDRDRHVARELSVRRRNKRRCSALS
jgi:hypothetical protein